MAIGVIRTDMEFFFGSLGQEREKGGGNDPLSENLDELYADLTKRVSLKEMIEKTGKSNPKSSQESSSSDKSDNQHQDGNAPLDERKVDKNNTQTDNNSNTDNKKDVGENVDNSPSTDNENVDNDEINEDIQILPESQNKEGDAITDARSTNSETDSSPERNKESPPTRALPRNSKELRWKKLTNKRRLRKSAQPKRNKFFGNEQPFQLDKNSVYYPKDKPTRKLLARKFRKHKDPKTGKYRHKPGEKALKEIRHYQRTVDLLLRKRPFCRIVREIVQDVSKKNDLRFQTTAMVILQTAVESMIVELMELTNLCAVHRGVVTINKRDMDLVLAIADSSSLVSGLTYRPSDDKQL